MKKTKISLLMAGLLAAGAMAPSAAIALDNATATVTATILIPIAVANNGHNMNFGYILPGTIGTVTLDTGGGRATNGPTLIGGITPTAAKFDVTGNDTATFSIDSTTGSSTTLASGANTMAITFISEAKAGLSATPTPVSSGSATTGTLAVGAAVIYAGGVLSVAAAQVPGVYTGNFHVTVAYN